MKAKDFLGRDIHVGDKLVIASHCRTSVVLRKGTVTDIGPKSLLVECEGPVFSGRQYPSESKRVFSPQNCVLYTD